MISTQPFGRTGHDSTRVIFGAAALGGMSQSRADQTLAVMSAAGINHIDTAASYGESELRLRDFLSDHRTDHFLATKTGERTGSAARRELETSLERLGVDHVDLIQLHNLVEPEEFEVAHGAGGAVEALVAARDEGLVRWIGVTGHGTRIADMHLRSLDRFDFDSVLLPYNASMMQNPAYATAFDALVARCATRRVAVQTIKSVARRRWPAESTEPHYAWYEPLPEGDALRRGVAFVLNREGLFLNTSSDGRLLPAIIAAATADLPMPTDSELGADMADLGITPLFDGAELERI
ncbi:MAG: Aldo/keto reductase [Acidimicrobiales bacterium]|nr:Aldo/keto reductase [Acidimicrobiales bacterium]